MPLMSDASRRMADRFHPYISHDIKAIGKRNIAETFNLHTDQVFITVGRTCLKLVQKLAYLGYKEQLCWSALYLYILYLQHSIC